MHPRREGSQAVWSEAKFPWEQAARPGPPTRAGFACWGGRPGPPTRAGFACWGGRPSTWPSRLLLGCRHLLQESVFKRFGAKRHRRRQVHLSGLLVIVTILIALSFDFINGFHDAANSIATVVSTRVLSPRLAVLWAAVLTLWPPSSSVPPWPKPSPVDWWTRNKLRNG